MGALPPWPTTDQALAWVRRQQSRHLDGTGFSFAIAEPTTDRALGQCGLWLTDMASGRGRIGYSVVPSARRRGVAADTVLALTAFAWTLPALHRLKAYVEPWNTGSIRALERAGYHQQRLLPGHERIGDTWRDLVLLVLTRP
ncbi:MAG: GNAT family N-acetyltransferase [Propionibacteriales bacterium]|nr:GNAT family N-acetyltransferase [Propionibacteriales bacterium]